MITYNHEHYIREAIESVIMQKTDFRIELIIGEDHSTDSTRRICEEYAKSFPEIVRLLPSRKNLGMIRNFIRTLEACTGKYIAICEGDDYWIDSNKLQKQVDFLETNPDYAICFHRVKILGKKHFVEDDITEQRYNTLTEFPINLNGLLTAGNFIHTPSVVFRNSIKEYPKEFSLSPVGDYFLYIILSQNGYIKRLEDIMAVYRKGTGYWSSLKDSEMTKNILLYQACILSYLKEKKHKQIVLEKHIGLIKKYFGNKHGAALKNLLKAVKERLINIHGNN